MAKKRKKPLARGPKSGKKHTPGRDHDRKSCGRKARRQIEKARKRREALEAQARSQWEVWDALNDEQKKMLGDLRPTLPRPDDGAT